MRFHHTPWLLQKSLPGLRWRVTKAPKDTIYLTFDDGPIPEETPWVLEQLARYDCKATFFCVGENLHRHPDVARQVLAAGHRLANHTHRHLRGWKTPLPEYLADVAHCQRELEAVQPGTRRLIRPPYGEASREQIKALRTDGYEVVMWSVLTYDFDAQLAPDVCLEQVIRHTKPGEIILFHDSIKASRNLRAVLPRYLEYLQGVGLKSAALPF